MENVLTNEEVIAIVKDIIEKDTYLEETEDGFIGEIYVDNQDELSVGSLKEITSADNILEAFDEKIWNMEIEASDYEWTELHRLIKLHWDEEEHGDFEDVEDVVIDFLNDNVHFHLPQDHFLKQDVLVNIMVDTGDGDYDYTLNNFGHSYYSEGEIDPESSLLWLVEQQGYTGKDLAEAINEGGSDNHFLQSVYEEAQNITTGMNALTFFVKMELREYIDMMDNKKGIVLNSSTSVGLYDPWNGAGSLLEISLDKDITIPAELMEPHIDGNRGYGVDNIYGMSSSHWTESVIKFI